MSERDNLNLAVSSIVALPFFENEKFVVGSKRGGGMGNVYQLIPLRPDAKPLALKTYQGDGDYVQFEREARIWISLSSHPHVARAITYGMLKNVRCILAAWYPRNAIDLDSRLLSCAEVLRFASGILTGLKEGHEQYGLIHKDIKPSNILVDHDNAPCLADFGISSFALQPPLHRQLYPNTVDLKRIDYDKNTAVSGTPIYMAPELFQGAKNTIRSDIFALGITLFEWLAGRHPYITSRGEFSCSHVATFSAEMLQRYGEEISPLIKLIFLAISLDEDDRPETYNQLLKLSSFSALDADQSIGSAHKEHRSILNLITKAQVLRRQGKVRDAIGVLSRELESRPDDVLLLTAYATTLIKVDQLSLAMPYLDRAVALNQKAENRYLGQSYVEPNVNRALLYLRAKLFDDAAEMLNEASRWLKASDADLSMTYWEFGWLALYEGRVENAVQRFVYYVSKRSSIHPVAAMFTLAAFMLPNTKDCFRKYFDLISATSCSDVLCGQYYSVMASYFDPGRIYKFNSNFLTPKVAMELEELSVAFCGARTGFKLPVAEQITRRLLLAVDDKYCGGKYRGIL